MLQTRTGYDISVGCVENIPQSFLQFNFFSLVLCRRSKLSFITHIICHTVGHDSLTITFSLTRS